MAGNMTGLYIYFDRQNPGTDGKAVGILKKVHSQHELFRERLGGCDLVNLRLRCGPSYAVIFLSCLFSRRMFDLSFLDGKKHDYVYVRRVTPNCRSVLHILRRIRGANPACRIVYEIPTYPYDAEHRSFAGMFVLLVDRHFRKKLSSYVDRIATLTDDGRIFGCPALRIRNGVDVASIPVCGKTGYGTGCLHMIAVAQFSFWHGYERVLEGMRDYYASGGRRKLVLHLVGDGPELEKYRELAGQYGLGERIIFHGTLSGCRLAEAFDTADIALCSLAGHKKGIYLSSELKSREYLSRGLPIVSSTKIDIIPDGCRFCLRVPEDDGPLDMQKIIGFADGLYGADGNGRISCRDAIRAFAEQTCGMDASMQSVLDFFSAPSVYPPRQAASRPG